MYVAEVNTAGDIRFEEWSDRDCEMALAAPRRMRATEARRCSYGAGWRTARFPSIRELAWPAGG